MRLPTIEVHRARILNANDRQHWAPKATLVKGLRWQAKTAALPEARRGKIRERVRIIVHVGVPDKRRRDAHNLMPTIKALIDGIVDSGLLADDDDKHIQGPDLRPYRHDRRDLFMFTFDFVAPEKERHP